MLPYGIQTPKLHIPGIVAKTLSHTYLCRMTFYVNLEGRFRSLGIGHRVIYGMAPGKRQRS